MTDSKTFLTKPKAGASFSGLSSNMKTNSAGFRLPVSILKRSSYEQKNDTRNTSASSLEPGSPSMSKASDRTQEDMSSSTFEESPVPEPPLDTIDPSKTASRSTKPSDSQRRSRKVAPIDSNQSPRSINMQTEEPESAPVVNGGIPFAPQQPYQTRPERSKKGKHRRASSDKVPGEVQGYMYQQPQAPPYYNYYPPATPPGYYSPQVGAPMPMRAPSPPLNLSYSTRTRSWSGDQADQTRPLLPPAPTPPLGRPASFQDVYSERRPLLSRQPQSDRNLSSKSRRKHRHRKSRSHSEGIPNAEYGAFWHGEAPASSQPSQNPFSARNEIMNLTSGFRSPAELSPRHVSPVTSYRKSAVTWSPSTPPPTYDTSYQGGGSTSPFVGGMPDLGTSPGGGEAVFMAQRRGHKSESTRKKHMRQQSAQLFMEDAKGEEQPLACRDVIFLLLFVFHLLGIAYLSKAYSYEALRLHDPVEEEDSSVTVYYMNLLYLACISGGIAIVLSGSLLFIMTLFARRFVQVALIVVITLSFVWGTIGIGLSPKTVVPVTGIIVLALTVAYAFIVWDRIPFAAANLMTALSGIRAFPGTIIVALVVQGVALAYTIYYTIVVIGVYNAIKEGHIALSERMEIVVYILLFISFYWTYQVLLNVVQVATAGIIGNWWYQPEGDAIVKRSSFKTIFYSMGSICFGSLFVGPVNVIRQVAVLFRPTSTDETSLMCLHECLLCVQTCITSCVDTLSDSFNWWAFTFIGLYGYGFLEAGHRATELFHTRGWTAIVSDDLVPNVLMMTSLVIGGVTGCVAHLLSAVDRLHVLSIDEPGLASFGTGVVIGLVLTRVLFGAVGSAVNAVLVCFASSPVDFERNHPELSQEMRAAWREVWPGALDMVDLRVALNVPGQPEPV